MRLTLPAALAAALLLAGCGGDAAVAPVASPSASPSPSAAVTAQPLGECAPPNLTTMTSGVLTVATDATPDEPYFVDDDPESGEGFESALTYAIATGLGFRSTAVEWVTADFGADGLPTAFGESGLPTAFDFDFAVNAIPITKQGAQTVDFSVPYLTVTVDKAGTTSTSGPAGAAGTTPATQDLGLVFAKGNPLVACVNEVLAGLEASGELDALAAEWLPPAAPSDDAS